MKKAAIEAPLTKTVKDYIVYGCGKVLVEGT